MDALSYLQGQLTNDIRELANTKFQLSAHLNNKGRIIASFIITLTNENSYLLITSHSMTNKILSRLKMFILRSKVTINQLNINIYFSDYHLDNCINIALRPDQFLCLSQDNLKVITSNNSTGWHKFLIEHGIPMIYQQSSEQLIPQQVNYDLIGGISFKKGCYTGQEIVARTHYLGKIKRRMCKFTTHTQPQIGQVIVSPRLDNQEVGVIVDFYADHDIFYGLAPYKQIV